MGEPGQVHWGRRTHQRAPTSPGGWHPDGTSRGFAGFASAGRIRATCRVSASTGPDRHGRSG
jgi:hypothetical protein